MRVLPIGANHVGERLIGSEPHTERRRHRRCDGRKHLPLRNVSAYPGRDQGGCEMSVMLARRDFLKFTATAALGGGFLLGIGFPVRGEVRDTLTTDSPFAPNAFLRIDRTGKVTFVMPVIEMGQGTYTSLPMLIAEELEVDVDKVSIEHSPPDDKIYANPLIGAQLTGSSASVRGAYTPLRRAGATARVMIVAAAAQRWQVEPSTCQAQQGLVVHGPSGRKLAYGDLVDAAAKLPVPPEVALKDPASFKLIGTPHHRLDVAGKVDGSAKF